MAKDLGPNREESALRLQWVHLLKVVAWNPSLQLEGQKLLVWAITKTKSERCFFIGYFEYVKVYRLVQTNSIEITIRKYTNLHEDLSTYEPDSTFVPSLTCKPSSSISSPFDNTPTLFSSFYDDNDDENPPLPTQIPPTLAPQLPNGFVQHKN